MNILVTGATGLLGNAIVLAALRADHHVKALVRPGRALDDFAWPKATNLEVCAVALEASEELQSALKNIDVVIHSAAAKSGDYAYQYTNTVVTTQALLAAMNKADVRRLIGIGSFAVFDYEVPRAGELLHADSPKESQPGRRDAYTQTKCLQEQCFAEFAQQGGEVTVLRPGIIYGPQALWQFCLGKGLGNKLWLRIGPDADELPWTYVENCADAVLAAATKPESIGATINIVDDERPGRSAFITKLNSYPELRKTVLPLPWWPLYGAAKVIEFVNAKLFGGRLPVPGLLRPKVLNVRFKPLRYSNERAKRLLGWQSRVSVDLAIQRSLESGK